MENEEVSDEEQIIKRIETEKGDEDDQDEDL